jgi:hypothetical protein
MPWFSIEEPPLINRQEEGGNALEFLKFERVRNSHGSHRIGKIKKTSMPFLFFADKESREEFHEDSHYRPRKKALNEGLFLLSGADSGNRTHAWPVHSRLC